MDEIFKNLHLQLSIEDIKKIDLWRSKHGMKSRSEAIRSIIRVATDQKNNSESFNDRERSNFISPSIENNNIKDMIRNMVKEELDKINK